MSNKLDKRRSRTDTLVSVSEALAGVRATVHAERALEERRESSGSGSGNNEWSVVRKKVRQGVVKSPQRP